jgi:hypothetical protein
MFLFVLAAKVWYASCGYDPQLGIAVNARLDGDVIEPCTPFGCRLIALASVPDDPVYVTGLEPGSTVQLFVDPVASGSGESSSEIVVTGGRLRSLRDGEFELTVEAERIKIRRKVSKGREK